MLYINISNVQRVILARFGDNQGFDKPPFAASYVVIESETTTNPD